MKKKYYIQPNMLVTPLCEEILALGGPSMKATLDDPEAKGDPNDDPDNEADW